MITFGKYTFLILTYYRVPSCSHNHFLVNKIQCNCITVKNRNEFAALMVVNIGRYIGMVLPCKKLRLLVEYHAKVFSFIPSLRIKSRSVGRGRFSFPSTLP